MCVMAHLWAHQAGCCVGVVCARCTPPLGPTLLPPLLPSHHASQSKCTTCGCVTFTSDEGFRRCCGSLKRGDGAPYKGRWCRTTVLQTHTRAAVGLSLLADLRLNISAFHFFLESQNRVHLHVIWKALQIQILSSLSLPLHVAKFASAASHVGIFVGRQHGHCQPQLNTTLNVTVMSLGTQNISWAKPPKPEYINE